MQGDRPAGYAACEDVGVSPGLVAEADVGGVTETKAQASSLCSIHAEEAAEANAEGVAQASSERASLKSLLEPRRRSC